MEVLETVCVEHEPKKQKGGETFEDLASGPRHVRNKELTEQ